jgi:hypothetical protein
VSAPGGYTAYRYLEAPMPTPEQVAELRALLGAHLMPASADVRSIVRPARARRSTKRAA